MDGWMKNSKLGRVITTRLDWVTMSDFFSPHS